MWVTVEEELIHIMSTCVVPGTSFHSILTKFLQNTYYSHFISKETNSVVK